MAAEWIAIKGDWKSSDSFEPEDYNRISNNIKYLNERLKEAITLTDMPNMDYDYQPWQSSDFNAIENNLHGINNSFNSGATTIGNKKTFYPNGVFITADELNRIEKGLLLLKISMENVRANQRRLSFKLGNFRNPRL